MHQHSAKASAAAPSLLLGFEITAGHQADAQGSWKYARPMPRLWVVLLLSFLMSAPAVAAKQTVVFTGTIEYEVGNFFPTPGTSSVTNPVSEVALLETGLPQGSPFEIVVEIDPSVPDQDATVGTGTYAAAKIIGGSIGAYPFHDTFNCAAPLAAPTPDGCIINSLDFGGARQFQIDLGFAYGADNPLNQALGRTATAQQVIDDCATGQPGVFRLPGAFRVLAVATVPEAELPPGIGESIDFDWAILPTTNTVQTEFSSFGVAWQDFEWNGSICEQTYLDGSFWPGATLLDVEPGPAAVPISGGVLLMAVLSALGWWATRRPKRP